MTEIGSVLPLIVSSVTCTHWISAAHEIVKEKELFLVPYHNNHGTHAHFLTMTLGKAKWYIVTDFTTVAIVNHVHKNRQREENK